MVPSSPPLVRNRKDYILEARQPIIGPANFNLNSALTEALEKEMQACSLLNVIGLEDDLSNHSDLSDLEDKDEVNGLEPPDCEQHSVTANIQTPSFNQSHNPFPKTLKSEGKDLAAQWFHRTIHKWGLHCGEERNELQGNLKTMHKQVTFKHGAQSKTLCTKEGFNWISSSKLCKMVWAQSLGFFHWVYNGFKWDKEFIATATKAQKEQWECERKAWWSSSLGMFSIRNDICAKLTQTPSHTSSTLST